MDYVTVLAASEAAGSPWAVVAAVVSAGVIIVGAGLSIAKIGGSAVESIARQPEAGTRVFSAMIIAAALVEGVTFFALLICFLAVFWLR